MAAAMMAGNEYNGASNMEGQSPSMDGNQAGNSSIIIYSPSIEPIPVINTARHMIKSTHLLFNRSVELSLRSSSFSVSSSSLRLFSTLPPFDCCCAVVVMAGEEEEE
jgi:hypothetical protein